MTKCKQCKIYKKKIKALGDFIIEDYHNESDKVIEKLNKLFGLNND